MELNWEQVGKDVRKLPKRVPCLRLANRCLQSAHRIPALAVTFESRVLFELTAIFSAQHYEHEDAYRSTWRRARAEAMAEAAPQPSAAAKNSSSRPASSDSNRSEMAMITTARSTNPSLVMGGFSSFV